MQWNHVQVPCGQCIGCRLNRSAQWALRMEHEASLHDQNCFLTLTYDDENLPGDSLVKKHYVDFFKRLRDYYNYPPVKYYHCGEYGGKTKRPHYHACVFGFDFPDKKLYKRYSVRGCDQEVRLYTSESLEARWGKGFCTIGDVTWSSAAYCARYVVDKITGPKAEAHYYGRTPEYSTSSNHIGTGWYEKYKEGLWNDDYAVSRGHRVSVPRYYEKKLAEEEPLTWDFIKETRRLRTQQKPIETERRLSDLEYIQVRRLELLTRILP